MRALLLQQRYAAALDCSWAAEISPYRRKELDEIAWSSIFIHLSDSVIRKVGETLTADSLRKKLEDLYLIKTMTNKCYLLRLFYNFRFDNFSSLEENIDKFTKLIQDLANCDEILSNDQQVVALLNSLGDKYKDVRNSLEYGRGDLTVDIVTSALRNKDLELREDLRENKNGMGLFMREKPGNCGIIKHRTVTYTPQQNGVAERMKRTLLNKVRCKLLSSDDLDKRRSTSSYVFILCDGCISWKSQLQKIVALSSTEAEYIAACDAVKERLWLRGLLGEIGFRNETIRLYTDNQSVIHLSKNPVYHDRTKHVDIKFHFVRDMVEKNIVDLIKIPTQFNPSDTGTIEQMKSELDTASCTKEYCTNGSSISSARWSLLRNMLQNWTGFRLGLDFTIFICGPLPYLD
ncbi:Reverse transcriptase Ty1/copia-type domain-containing protein [Abeliophyllum distichum]|uniref:Reverse transcriptase Ty1/copia-type domain-containing protein n=1 Tax=Abeliophyllum distichum TaxID=126358 RepID=A0ABD1TIC6_9LAMI